MKYKSIYFVLLGISSIQSAMAGNGFSRGFIQSLNDKALESHVEEVMDQNEPRGALNVDHSELDKLENGEINPDTVTFTPFQHVCSVSSSFQESVDKLTNMGILGYSRWDGKNTIVEMPEIPSSSVVVCNVFVAKTALSSGSCDYYGPAYPVTGAVMKKLEAQALLEQAQQKRDFTNDAKYKDLEAKSKRISITEQDLKNL